MSTKDPVNEMAYKMLDIQLEILADVNRRIDEYRKKGDRDNEPKSHD